MPAFRWKTHSFSSITFVMLLYSIKAAMLCFIAGKLTQRVHLSSVTAFLIVKLSEPDVALHKHRLQRACLYNVCIVMLF